MRVSFVIPSYNQVQWLPHAIESCLNQTFKDIEVVIIDDCSTDSTKQYLNWLMNQKDSRIRAPLPDKHLGRSGARNYGNSMASGDVICVLDSDDYCSPDRAKLTVDKIMKGADFVYGSADVIDLFGNKVGELHADVFNLKKAEEKMTNGIVHSSVGYSKEIALSFPYSEDADISRLGLDDWEQQIRLARVGKKFDFIPQSIVAYRLHADAISHVRSEREVLETKKRILSPIPAC